MEEEEEEEEEQEEEGLLLLLLLVVVVVCCCWLFLWTVITMMGGCLLLLLLLIRFPLYVFSLYLRSYKILVLMVLLPTFNLFYGFIFGLFFLKYHPFGTACCRLHRCCYCSCFLLCCCVAVVVLLLLCRLCCCCVVVVLLLCCCCVVAVCGCCCAELTQRCCIAWLSPLVYFPSSSTVGSTRAITSPPTLATHSIQQQQQHQRRGPWKPCVCALLCGSTRKLVVVEIVVVVGVWVLHEGVEVYCVFYCGFLCWGFVWCFAYNNIACVCVCGVWLQ